MNGFVIVQIALVVMGFVMGVGGQRLEMPLLSYGGLALLGCAFLAVALEAVFTRQISFLRGSITTTYTDTYSGIAAILYGLYFLLVGAGIIAVAVVLYLDVGRPVFLSLVRHPGPALALIGIVLLISGVIAIIGAREYRRGPGWQVFLALLTSRLLPAIILFALGLGALGLGLYEIASPEAFDSIGGGFLEALFGGQ